MHTGNAGEEWAGLATADAGGDQQCFNVRKNLEQRRCVCGSLADTILERVEKWVGVNVDKSQFEQVLEKLQNTQLALKTLCNTCKPLGRFVENQLSSSTYSIHRLPMIAKHFNLSYCVRENIRNPTDSRNSSNLLS